MPADRASLRVLTFSSLYPNAALEGHGVFVENRARHLAAEPGIDLRVVAPVACFGRYAAGAAAPREEVRHGIQVSHPRYVHVPWFGAWLAPRAIYSCAKPRLESLRRDGFDFDLIDGHYLHPDGAAAALLARHFDVPLVLTARGSDVTWLPNYRLRRKAILAAIARADAVVSVAEALVPGLRELGGPDLDVAVLRNGVDLEMFHPPADRDGLRRNLDVDGPTLLSVGHLVERKGHHLVIEALRHLPEHRLVIAGEGPEHRRLEQLVQRMGLQNRVRLLGAVRHADLAEVYGAADALVLASSREGWANVLLEAMACGTPTIATAVGGSPEVVSDPTLGELTEERSAAGIADAVRRLRQRGVDRVAVRAYAEQHSWDATSRGQVELFHRVVAQHRSRRG